MTEVEQRIATEILEKVEATLQETRPENVTSFRVESLDHGRLSRTVWARLSDGRTVYVTVEG